VATRSIELLTRRLVLRQWRDEDRTPFAALNADPLVMEHFPAVMTRDQEPTVAAGDAAHRYDAPPVRGLRPPSSRWRSA